MATKTKRKRSAVKVSRKRKEKQWLWNQSGVLLMTLLVGIVIILALGAVFGNFWLKSPESLNKKSSENNQPLELIVPLTDPEYDQIIETLNEITEEQDPVAALAYLGKQMGANPSVSRSCHGFVHEIGHAAFRKYGDFARAISYQNDLCGSGYIHGVIESHLKGVADPLAEVSTLCQSFNNGGSAATCYHGVGHGFMFYTDNDLPLSIAYCDALKTFDNRGYCAEGVFMENFSALLEAHDSDYLRPDDPAFPCQEQQAFYKPTCYFYAPTYYLSLYNDDFTGALAWCSSIEAEYQSYCARGVGRLLMKQNIDYPDRVEAVCAKSILLKSDCIEGLVSYYLVHFDSLTAGEQLCSQMSGDSLAVCRVALEKRQHLFQD